MAKDSDAPLEITPTELVRKLRLSLARQQKTADRNRHINQLFPDGIGPCEEEKVVARIRQHYPDLVSRAELRSMNPGDLDVYLQMVIEAESASPERPGDDPEGHKPPDVRTVALNATEAATYVGVSDKTMRGWIKGNTIDADVIEGTTSYTFLQHQLDTKKEIREKTAAQKE